MWRFSPEAWTAIGTLIIAAGTLAAAGFAASAARATRKAAQGQLLVTLLTEWGFNEMRQAIKELTSWRDSNDESQRALASSMKPFRQTVSLYFQKVYLLHKNRSISDGVLEAVASKGQAALYLAIEPLERHHNRKYSAISFEFYARMYELDRAETEGWDP